MIRHDGGDVGGPEAAAEALNLFHALSDLSLQATAAAAESDGETVLSLLAERAVIMERADGLVGRLMEQTRNGTGSAPASLLDAAHRLSRLDADLQVALEAQRDALARDLSTLEIGGAARSAYGGKQRGRGTINVMR